MLVIIPSRTASNLGPCVAAVRKHEPDAHILVVDDGVLWDQWDRAPWGHTPDAIQGERPFVFARNVNAAVRFAAELETELRGWVVLNDDAMLETPGGFSVLERAAWSSPTIAAVGATTNLGHRNQKSMGVGLRIVPHCAYVAIYFKRVAWDEIGELDERFTAYGYEDNDWSLRCSIAGWRLAVHDGCYVDHGSLRSTFRGDPKTPAALEPGRAIFMGKWKHFANLKQWL